MNFSIADTSAVNLTISSEPTMHTESGPAKSGCIYCLAKVIHPRLGRGESYACGYKPYRCEICNYSTVTKGNLAIHEQSDRHLNNIQEYDQHQKLQESADRRLIGKPPDDNPLPSSTTQTSPMASLSQNLFQFLESFSPKSGFCPQDEISLTLLEVSDHALFCLVCGVFSTNNVEDLIAHAEQNRIPMNMDFANQQVTSQSTGAWHCSLCSYRSSLKANFQLHCKTEKHAQRLSLLLHVWEGKGVDLAISLRTNLPAVAPTPKINVYCQLKCLPCAFFTYSVHKMRVHCQMPEHTFLVGIFGSLVTKRSKLKLSLRANSDGGDRASTARFIYACRRCEITCSSVRALMLHFQSSNDHIQLGRQPCEQDDVNVLWVSDGGDNSHHPIPTNNFPLNQIRRKEETDREGEGVTQVYQKPGSSFSHQCEYEKTMLEGLNLRRSSSTDKSSPMIDDEFGGLQRHSAPPAFNANPPFESSQSTKTSSELDSSEESSTLNDDHALHPLLADTLCQTSGNESGSKRGRMHVIFDPISVWLSDNLQNPEILQGLAKLIDEQKQQISIPKTSEALFAWLGPDNSLSFFVTCWLRHQFPLMDGAIANEFVALIFEMIAQQKDASGRFLDLQELQQQHAFDICHLCSPPRLFLLSSSASIHQTLHHNKELPATVLETFEKVEKAVVGIVLAFQSQQTQLASTKCLRNLLFPDQLEALKSNLSFAKPLNDKATMTICEKTGLREELVQFKNEPKPPTDLLKASVNQSSPEKAQNTETPLKSTSSTKRFRTPISSSQQALLLRFFQVDQNPSRRQMDIISSKVNLPKRVVQVWFQNARSRERRMYVKYAPHQSQSPKPPLFLPPMPTPPWQLREAVNQTLPVNELGSLIYAAASADSTLESSSINKLQQIFNQILSQMTQPTAVPHQAPLLPASKPTELNESDSPLDLSTVSIRSNGQLSPSNLPNLSPQTGSSTSGNETKSDNFCRRNRTSISSTQARFMLWFFQHHKTPTISECENIGHAIGLSRRVVQVWFQNQRAKEKKIARATAVCGEVSSATLTKNGDSQLLVEGNECKLCNVKIIRLSDDDTAAITEHIFSKTHIHRLLSKICQGDSCITTSEKMPCSQSEMSSE
ncbi:hypothetical protein Aperf_G00000008852 [Anoplocephala perfoliata]